MNAQPQAGDNRPASAWSNLMNLVVSQKIEVLLWLTRIWTMMFSLAYLYPFYGVPYNLYYKAMMAYAATSALRLHQRRPPPSRDYIYDILREDSCHYFLYTIIFLCMHPFTLALVPIFFFSLIHVASYSLVLLDAIGQNSWWGARLLISLVELQSRKILYSIALFEILQLPVLVLSTIFGGSFIVPFAYYYFLTLRLRSQRNPYTRDMLNELRVFCEDWQTRQNSPFFLKFFAGIFRKICLQLTPAPVDPAPR